MTTAEQLPPLPQCARVEYQHEDGWSFATGRNGVEATRHKTLFTADQMQAYARQAISALEAENERLRADAERYLFIRALYGPTGNQHEWEAMDWALLKGGQILDSEIDAAMKEQTL